MIKFIFKKRHFSLFALVLCFSAGYSQAVFAIDQCNTTKQCQTKYSNATDCKDSRSANSVCMCGSKECGSSSGGSGGPSGGPNGYTFAANEGETVRVRGTVDIAYGAKGKFKKLKNRSSNVACSNSTFGDPIKGTKKACYVKKVSGGGSSSSSSSSGGSSMDQCNTTKQCQAVYGNRASDCRDSQSNKSVCMCGSSRCDGNSNPNPTPNPGNPNNPTNPGSNIPQPPASCSNASNSIPSGIRAHNIFRSNIKRSEFGSITRWYTEKGKVQRFQLHNGDQNQRTRIKRPRLETFNPNRFKRNSGWHEFSANYYLSGWDKPQRYAVFQIKTNDASNFIIQGLIHKDGSLRIARRSKGSIKIDDNVMRKPFHLRVRSNGRKFEVYYNCKRVIAEDHPQPRLENNNTQYGWRWGLYRQASDDDKQDGTTTLHVTGPKFN